MALGSETLVNTESTASGVSAVKERQLEPSSGDKDVTSAMSRDERVMRQVSVESSDETATADDAAPKEAPGFEITQDQTEAMARSFRAVTWVRDGCWLVIGNSADERQWPFRVFALEKGRMQRIGRGVAANEGTGVWTVSLTVSAGEARQTIHHQTQMDYGPDTVLEEYASRAAKRALDRLEPADPARNITFAWVERRPDAKRWPVHFVSFEPPQEIIVPGYAEINMETGMVLVYPFRVM
jgi:hypothetical protein